MDAWGDIRLKARDWHRAALAKAGGDRTAEALLTATLTLNDLELSYYAEGEKAGPGVIGFLDRASLLVHVQLDLPKADEYVVIGHELGHFALHTDPGSEVTTAQSQLGGDPIDSGAGRVEGYSSRGRKEIQADVFAGELLCPADWLREQVVDLGRRPSEIAIEPNSPMNFS